MYFLPEKRKQIRGNPGEQEGPNIRRFDVDVNIKNLHTVTDSETSIRHGQRIKLTPIMSGANSTIVALRNDYLIGIKDMAVQRNVQLPEASVAGAGKVFMVKDMVGGASTTNIVIAAVEGETIDGNASTTLSTNYDSKTLVSDGTSWYTGVYVPPSSAWQLISSASASGTTDFTNLGDYNEIMVVFEEVTASSAVTRNVQVSSDNGSTFYSTSGDYEYGSSPATAISISSGTTLARNAWVIIHNFNVARYKPVTNSYTDGATVCKALAMDAVRCGGATLNGGTIYVYGR